MKRIRNEAFTRTELVVTVGVAFVVAVLVGMLLPAGGGCKTPANRITCVNYLKQVGIGFRLFANDHDEKFPMQVSTNEGGSREYTRAADVFRHFQAAGPDIGSPRVLRCPADLERSAAAVDFRDLQNTNLSYFVTPSATTNDYGSLLAGDRNLTRDRKPVGPGTYFLKDHRQWGFDPETLHKTGGNIALADGSVQQVSSAKFSVDILRTCSITNTVVVP